ncbi:MAG: sigma-70 family RNA polymerase sigma factor, partial [Spirochaetes bacterium]|nr:sigma-70 family RNA polymerase sigma factor [Spirochaetota bacterium]
MEGQSSHATESRIKNLVIRSQLGDTGAFAQLVRAYERMAMGYAYAKLSDFHLAEDACQEAFTDAFLKLGSLRDPYAFPGWLRTVVRKHAERVRRKRGTINLPYLPEMDESLPSQGYGRPEEILEREEEAERARAMIATLPAGQREAATLCYVDGCNVPEIARFLDIGSGTVRKRLHDARKTLTKTYGKENVMVMEKELGRLLESHLSPLLVQRALEQPSVLKLKGERRVLSVLMVDAIGIGEVLEPMPAEEAVEYLNEYLNAAYRIVLENDGFMDKVIGDEIMAFWGTAIQARNHAELACRTALAIQKRLKEMHKEWQASGRPGITASVGINTGEVIIGSFGPPDIPSYTPMGH